ncbi:MAG: carboxymuconolactone decarboxylase family protein [Acidimicrobiia bacterium]
MAFIGTIPENEAKERVAGIYEEDREGWGFVPNFTQVFALRPDVYDAWGHLITAIRAGMDRRRYELATVAAAQQLRSSYCTMAHSRVLRARFYDTETVRDIVIDRNAAGLDEVDLAIMNFAERVVVDAASITEEDIKALKEVGLSDGEILDVALAAAARSFFAKVLDAVGAPPDPEYREMLEPELQEALTVGRPIEDG